MVNGKLKDLFLVSTPTILDKTIIWLKAILYSKPILLKMALIFFLYLVNEP